MKVLIYAHSQQDLLAINQYLTSETYGAAFRGTGALLEVVYNEGLGLEHIETEAVIAPGNSYGIMTGGFDLGLVQAYGTQLEEKVQDVIIRNFGGELNVGDCIVVPIERSRGNDRVLLYAPTMRVPKKMHHDSDVPYMATRVALLKAKAYFKRDNFSILIPLMCHGTGGIPVDYILHQIQLAVGQVNGCETMLIKDLSKGVIVDNLIVGRARFSR